VRATWVPLKAAAARRRAILRNQDADARKLAPNRVHYSIKCTLSASINLDNALALEFLK
jgi:hypothetical protein